MVDDKIKLQNIENPVEAAYAIKKCLADIDHISGSLVTVGLPVGDELLKISYQIEQLTEQCIKGLEKDLHERYKASNESMAQIVETCI